MLRIENLVKRYPSGEVALRGVSLEIAQGEVAALIGPSGAGGIGATLNTAFDRYEFDSAAAILLIIIAIVMGAEYASGYVRQKLV